MGPLQEVTILHPLSIASDIHTIKGGRHKMLKVTTLLVINLEDVEVEQHDLFLAAWSAENGAEVCDNKKT